MTSSQDQVHQKSGSTCAQLTINTQQVSAQYMTKFRENTCMQNKKNKPPCFEFFLRGVHEKNKNKKVKIDYFFLSFLDFEVKKSPPSCRASFSVDDIGSEKDGLGLLESFVHLIRKCPGLIKKEKLITEAKVKVNIQQTHRLENPQLGPVGRCFQQILGHDISLMIPVHADNSCKTYKVTILIKHQDKGIPRDKGVLTPARCVSHNAPLSSSKQCPCQQLISSDQWKDKGASAQFICKVSSAFQTHKSFHGLTLPVENFWLLGTRLYLPQGNSGDAQVHTRNMSCEWGRGEGSGRASGALCQETRDVKQSPYNTSYLHSDFSTEPHKACARNSCELEKEKRKKKKKIRVNSLASLVTRAYQTDTICATISLWPWTAAILQYDHIHVQVLRNTCMSQICHGMACNKLIDSTIANNKSERSGCSVLKKKKKG
ncbi:hypothetical protein VP01_362g2 [Puccinia sorghi]|uniref:Uncharacterized protein n=1 Tax=Puccinia sorghi TaxID=27349 RepID=A0A0L6UWL4_9BASI|nr:hypothetical protein VP01_362g2 [Puccinia sorghi]